MNIENNSKRPSLQIRYPRTILTLAFLAMLTSTGSLTLSRDLLVRYQTQAQLQAAADIAAAAGAAYLPARPERAIRAAMLAVKRGAAPGSEIVYAAPAPDGTSFEVALRGSAPVILLGLLLHGNASVTAIATRAAGLAHPDARTGRLVTACNGGILVSDGGVRSL
jgi:hypothetical protein